MGRPLAEPSHGDDRSPAQPIPSTVAPGRAVRPLQLPYHLAYAAATASQTPSDRTFKDCSNRARLKVYVGAQNEYSVAELSENSLAYSSTHTSGLGESSPESTPNAVFGFAPAP